MIWLTLLTTVPPTPTRHHVGAWRKHQRMGAVRLRGSAWILPETALHNHALLDTPRLFYMRFRATRDAGWLAQGLRAALDMTNSAKPAGAP